MNDKLALDIVDKIFNNVFDTDNNYSLEELLDKVAFRLTLLPIVNLQSVFNTLFFSKLFAFFILGILS